MDKEKLRYECKRLIECYSIADSEELIDVYSELFFRFVMNHHEEPVYSQADSDAKIILQMVMTKTLYIKSTIQGISYDAKDGSIMKKIIDPTIVASLVRNIYETVGLFNLIYRDTKNTNEKNIIYLLWVISGLKHRQRFEDAATTNENITKYEQEKKDIETYTKHIEDNDLFNKLNSKDQEKIRTKLKQRDYKIRFEDNEVFFVNWNEMTTTMGIKEDLFEHIYTDLSFYSHPSNVAVFQFGDMFEEGKESFLELTNFFLKIAFILFSIFIADYINLFPSVLKTYNSMNIRDQFVINYFNTLTRGNDYSINDSLKYLQDN